LCPAFRKPGKKCLTCLIAGLFYPVFGVFKLFFTQALDDFVQKMASGWGIFNTFTGSQELEEIALAATGMTIEEAMELADAVLHPQSGSS
jgi:hypothetical protein